jgi:hypothetical protein
MAACNCDITLNNTGTPSCTPIMGVGVKPIMVPLTADDGTANVITISSYTGSQAEWDARTENLDRSKRYYPLPEFKNVEDIKGDTIFESFNDTSNLFVQEGTRTYTGILPNQAPTLLGNLKDAKCTKFGLFIIDDCGNLIGNISSDGLSLEPVPVDQNTWNPILIKSTDTTVQKIQLSFEFSRLTKDEDLRIIKSTDSQIALLDLEGLVDLEASFANEATTGVEATVSYDRGEAAKVAFTGVLFTEWTLFNKDTQLAVTVLTGPESPAGTYTLTWAAEPSGDVLQLSLIKDGFELYKAEFTTP